MLNDGCSRLPIQRPRGHRDFHFQTRVFHNFSQFFFFFTQSRPFSDKIFHVTIWTNPPRTEYFFNIWKCNSLRAWPADPTPSQNCQNFPHKRDLPFQAMHFTTWLLWTEGAGTEYQCVSKHFSVSSQKHYETCLCAWAAHNFQFKFCHL